MADNLPLKLTLADSRWIQRQVDEGIAGVFEIARKWPQDPPPATEAERSPRYADSEVRAEIAMALYRAACRFGLYHDGIESKLIAALQRTEAALDRVRARIAAQKDPGAIMAAVNGALEEARDAPAAALQVALASKDAG